jgi:hypothetical protein
VNFAAKTLYVVSQRMFIVVSVYFVIDSVWNLLDTQARAHTHTRVTLVQRFPNNLHLCY